MNRFSISFLLLFFCVTCKSQSDESKGQEEKLNHKAVVCFVYHRFGDARYPTTNVAVKDFEAHLNYLIKNDFQVLSFSDAIAYLKSDEPAKKTVVITIDDAFKSFYTHGLPLLKKYSLPATLFMNTKTVGGGDYMNWRELQEAKDSDVEIGNHTHSHDFFLNQPANSRYKTFSDEIELSQKIIYENLKVRPVLFSFPYGEFDEQMKAIVKAAGFEAAAAQNSGVMHAGMDFFLCPRFPMSEAYAAPKEFAQKANMKPLKVLSQSPDNIVLTANKQPALTLTIDNTDLLVDRLQCFVQGSTCKSHIETTGNKTSITLQAITPISKRRRTLYTLTIPDRQGNWHWFSRLWIEPGQKGE